MARKFGGGARDPGALYAPGFPGSIRGRPVRQPGRRHLAGLETPETRQREEEHMTRITGVPSAQAGLYVKIAYHFTRRSIAKLAGRRRSG